MYNGQKDTTIILPIVVVPMTVIRKVAGSNFASDNVSICAFPAADISGESFEGTWGSRGRRKLGGIPGRTNKRKQTSSLSERDSPISQN
jgi:hypothetical protein